MRCATRVAANRYTTARPTPNRAAASVIVNPPGLSATNWSSRSPRSSVCAVSSTPRRVRAQRRGTVGRYPFIVTLRLYDTATRSVRDFVPKTPGHVGIYLCGLTVQGEPHIGHLRGGVNYDVLRRWLMSRGYAVTFIRNVTDIDDKILVTAVEQGRPFWS